MKIFKNIPYIPWLVVMLVICVTAASCSNSKNPTAPELSVVQTDGESEGLPSSLSLLHEASIGNNHFKVYAEKAINAVLLLEGIDENDTAEVVKSKIDAKRIALYPEEQIVIDVACNEQIEENPQINVAATLTRVRYVIWWYHNNAFNYYWNWREYANVAVLYISVLKGSYDTYSYYNGSYRFYQKLNAGITVALDSYGNYQLRGFKGIGKSTSNQAHIVMYWYK